MLPATELHGAFAWDCDNCGIENFCRAIEGNLDEAALMADENQVECELLAPNCRDTDEDELMESELLIQRILVVPKTVMCSHCGREYQTEVYRDDE